MFIRVGLLNRNGDVYAWTGIQLSEIKYYREWRNEESGKHSTVIFFKSGYELEGKTVNDLRVDILENRLSKILEDAGLLINTE